jgi:tetratricopeptide (TPR) repeat protein
MKPIGWLILALLAVPPAAPADSADSFVQQALAAAASFNARTALSLLLKADAARPNDPFILQKISEQYSDSMGDTRDPAEKKHLAEKALAYAQRAVALQPENAVNVLSVAISYGKLGLCSDTRTEIEYSRFVKDYAERALALDPNYDWACHVLGRWHYEVASLGATRRFFVKLIYGGLPPASSAEAVRLLRRAIELAPQTVAHHVELGFAYLADKQPGPARAEFAQAVAMPPHEKYDVEEKARAQAALEKLR